MKKESAFIRIYRFYLEGFREMKLGKTLWLIILVKLFIMFFILRLFFFPNYLGQFDSDSGEPRIERTHTTGNKSLKH